MVEGIHNNWTVQTGQAGSMGREIFGPQRRFEGTIAGLDYAAKRD